jgi:hypothetical protein
MRLIIEIEDDMDLVKFQSFINNNNIDLLDKSKSKKRTRKDFAQWCRQNSTPINEIPSREERNER